MQRYIKHSKEGSTVLLFKNGELINKGHKEVLPVIESIFMPMRLFINLLYLTQKGEMFITLDDSKKKEIFEKMLDLGVYQTYVEHCDKKIKDVVAEMSSITSKINVCNEMITTFSDQLVNFENNRIKFNDKKTSDILELTERLSSLEVKKDQLKVKLPTAPLNPSGFPADGKGFTFIVTAFELIVFFTFCAELKKASSKISNGELDLFLCT